MWRKNFVDMSLTWVPKDNDVAIATNSGTASSGGRFPKSHPLGVGHAALPLGLSPYPEVLRTGYRFTAPPF